MDNHFFSDYTKLLILGNAGMGKSTFLRYIVLCIIQNRKNKYLRNSNDIIPILLPLKAIQNHQKSPILNYIFSELSIFKGEKGKKRFLKIANKQKFLLLLDGYDELGFVQGVNYAQYEINILLSTRIDKADGDKINSEYAEYYRALCSCGTCLSSREEFYRTYSLTGVSTPHTESIQSLGHILNDFIALRILGLDNNRINFVKSIFNRYKSRAKIFEENLDEELFIDNIDKTHDSELIKFSRTPLFLTIMCYIYAEKIKENPAVFENVWSLKLEELITECVKILLKDLDEYKVRNLTKAQQLAFTRRRSDYFDEKLAFLNYFSFKLISDGKPIFDYKYITDQTKCFFTDLYKNDSSRLILEELADAKSDNPNFPTQLIFSGIFSTVSIISSELSYDYPHRRFREILAIKYLETNNKLDELLASITNPTLTEFIILVFITKGEYRNAITQSLLNEFYTNTEYSNANSILAECISKTDFDITDLIELNVQNWILLNTSIKISGRVLRLCRFNPSFVKTLEERLVKTSEENLNAINLVLTILNQVKGFNLIDSTFKGLSYTSNNNLHFAKILLFKTVFEFINRNKAIENYVYKSDPFFVSELIEMIKGKAREKEELDVLWIRELTNDYKREVILGNSFNSRIPTNLILEIIKEKEFLESLTFEEKIVVVCNPIYLEAINKTFLKTFLSDQVVLETLSLTECKLFVDYFKEDLDIYKIKINEYFKSRKFYIEKLGCGERLALVIGLFRATKIISTDLILNILYDLDTYLLTLDIFGGTKLTNAIKQIAPEIDSCLFDLFTIYAYSALLRDRIPDQPHAGLGESSIIGEIKGIVEKRGESGVVNTRKSRLKLENTNYFNYYKEIYDLFVKLIPEKVPARLRKAKKPVAKGKKISKLRSESDQIEMERIIRNEELIEEIEARNMTKKAEYEELIERIDVRKYDISFLDTVLIE